MMGKMCNRVADLLKHGKKAPSLKGLDARSLGVSVDELESRGHRRVDQTEKLVAAVIWAQRCEPEGRCMEN